MMQKKSNTMRRIIFASLFVLLVGAEFLIGIYAKDDFIRPYAGDVIIVIVLYALIRTVFPNGLYWLSGAIFLFAAAVEFSQILPLANVLGVTNPFLRILMGTSFAWADIVCYAVGCAMTAVCDLLLRSRAKKQ